MMGISKSTLYSYLDEAQRHADAQGVGKSPRTRSCNCGERLDRLPGKSAEWAMVSDCWQVDLKRIEQFE
ncbi:MAG: hypothetical protein JF606_03860 [Burkholderiales bacterium]|jgi:hypothetical protein|nr:hypothetical protein [Burkholderiales bacterium]